MSCSVVNMCCKQEEQFNKAMALTGSEFKAKVKYFSDVWIPAMTLAEAATEKQFEVNTCRRYYTNAICQANTEFKIGCDLNNWLLTLILLIHQN